MQVSTKLIISHVRIFMIVLDDVKILVFQPMINYIANLDIL